MFLNYHYWFFKKALSNKLCDDIVKSGLKQKSDKALTLGYENKKLNKKEKNSLLKLRNSEVSWLSDVWIYKEIHPYIHEANIRAGWNFDWDYTEKCQFTIYGKNQHYGWHYDSMTAPYDVPNNPNFNKKIRKLSAVISLSDPKDYKGGELLFDLSRSTNYLDKSIKCSEIKERGSIVVFPSFLWHTVTPVTKGTRYSLVTWSLGFPFK
jgi:PKHD-type hydroxylase